MLNLSNPLVLLITVLLVVTIVMVVAMAVIPYLIKKGINVNKYVKTADDVLDKADTVIKVVDDILPNNPVLNVLKIVEKYAHIGVNQAEQLYIASQLKADERNAKAKDTIYTVLKLMNIEVTSEMEKIIDGAIETEVLALGHKPIDEVEKQKQVQAQIQAIQNENIQLQQKNVDLENQNSQFKNAISTVQNTVQAIAQ